MPQYRNVVLCGFMGSGKTTVGRLLAKRTGLPFVDMDDYIEEKAGMAVSEIFKRHGEAYFRDLEHEASKELQAGTAASSARAEARLCTSGMSES